jgi:18S rRNA (guanine1575-N7)-methyltransferase
MATRAMELLSFPADDHTPRLILDLGCGSGISSQIISQYGHNWIGMDISESMIRVAKEDFDAASESKDMDQDDDDEGEGKEDSEYEEEEGEGEEREPHLQDLLVHDMGTGVCFRPGTFDGCISISALQWLFHSNRSYENPKRRLTRLFVTLHSALTRSARAVFQFFPSNADQIDLALSCASKAGFSGGIVVDYPNSTKAKKYYLCLMTGGDGIAASMPKGLTEHSAQEMEYEESDNEEDCEARTQSMKSSQKTVKIGPRQRQKLAKIQKATKDRSWVLRKKELYRKRGKVVKEDTKYTARKRRPRF